MSTGNEDIRLVISINNKIPVELIDLTKSLLALSNQFAEYVEREGHTKAEREAKLYVKEIRSGSVIVELVEFSTFGVLPFVENVNTIIGFGEYLKKGINFFLKGEGEKPDMTINDYKDIATIINPVAKDNGSNLVINTTINGNITLHLNLNSTESNAVQNILKIETEKIKSLEPSEVTESKAIMTLFQVRSDIKSNVGNKGKIESLHPRPLNIIFEDESIKETMFHSDINPFNTAFIVDVKMESVNEKPTVYRILKLHEYFDIE